VRKFKKVFNIEFAIKIIISLMILVGVLLVIYINRNDLIKNSDFVQGAKNAITIEPKDADEAKGFKIEAEVDKETAEYFEEQLTKEMPSFEVLVGEDVKDGRYEIDSQIAEPGCQVQVVTRKQGETNDRVNVLDHNQSMMSIELEEGDSLKASYYCKNEEGVYKFAPDKTMMIKYYEEID